MVSVCKKIFYKFVDFLMR